MVFKIKQDLNKRRNFLLIFYKKELLKSFYKNPKFSIQERHLFKVYSLKTINFKYSIVRIKNHCILTQNQKSIYKCVKLSRHIFKNKVLNGELPG